MPVRIKKKQSSRDILKGDLLQSPSGTAGWLHWHKNARYRSGFEKGRLRTNWPLLILLSILVDIPKLAIGPALPNAAVLFTATGKGVRSLVPASQRQRADRDKQHPRKMRTSLFCAPGRTALVNDRRV